MLCLPGLLFRNDCGKERFGKKVKRGAMKIGRKTKHIICYSIAGIVILLAGTYLCRGLLLQHFAQKRIARLEQRFGLEINYQNLQLEGLNTVNLQSLAIIPQERDTLLTLQALKVRFSLWKLLGGQPDIRNVHLDQLNVRFIKQDSVANYDFLFLPSKETQKNTADEKKNQSDYTRRVHALMKLIFGLLPENGELNKMQITERKDSNFVMFRIPSFLITNNRFHSEIAVKEDTLNQQWMIEGELNRSERHIQVYLNAPLHKRITLPYINRRFGAQVNLDSLKVSLSEEEISNDLTSLKGHTEVKGLQVYHRRLSPDIINLNRGELEYHLNVTPTALELDSTSLIRFNTLTFHPYMKAERVQTQSQEQLWHFTASIDKSWFPAQELFGSLPAGLFDNLEGIRTRGQLSYHFLFDVDFSSLDNLKFESELKAKDFRIDSFGRTPLNKMSGEFEYTAYENGQPVRTFPIGPTWEHFTPLDSIPSVLQMSVMQSEDGAFFYHQGFLPDAMREALIHDLKVRKFARGGSTISMQLVKNIFLNRNKNIARKLEEALIVWLIETERLTPKVRMYEVYLNIAEWGPMIYGIQEASKFYFDKRPSQLSVEECIYLASIIPKPKHFRNSFTENGQLKESQEGYFRLIAERLVKKGIISEAQAEQIQIKNVVLNGEAKESFLVISDEL